MAQADPVVGLWRHSFEEDRGGGPVYRPDSFDFPLARGRAAIEFRPDGTFVEWVVGRGDASEPRLGRWSRGPEGDLGVTRADGSRAGVALVGAGERLQLRDLS